MNPAAQARCPECNAILMGGRDVPPHLPGCAYRQWMLEGMVNASPIIWGRGALQNSNLERETDLERDRR